jgi:hypothetical protein
MKALLLLVCAAALLLCVHADCTALVTIAARSGGSYQMDGVNNQIYDITVLNTGTVSITSLVAYFGYPPSDSVVQSWNYDSTTGSITGFVILELGQAYTGAGFILAGSAAPVLAFTVATCSGSTEAPTNPPTNPPTNSPTNPPTNSPTNPPTPTPGACNASVVVNIRVGNGFLDNGIPSRIWDLVFTNTGSSPITSIIIAITPSAGTAVNQNNKWNLDYSPATNLYTVELFNSLYLGGSMYTGAGFVIGGSATAAPTVIISSVLCS